MVTAILLVVAVLAALYFSGYLQGLAFGTVGSPQYMVTVSALSTNEFKLNVKNIGQVAIEKADVKILDGISKSEIWKVTLDFKSANKVVKQGQEATLTCAVGFGCTYTVSGHSGEVTLKTTWPPTNLIAGRPYIISVKLYFANGQTKTWTTTVTATS